MVIINRLAGEQYEQIGVVEDGQVVDGGERIERLVESFPDTPTDDDLIERYDGPYVVAERASDTDDRDMAAGDDGPAWEQALEQVYERVVWNDDTGRDLFAFDPEDVPEFAIDALRAAILEGGALFSDFETVPDSARMAVQTAMLDSLEARHGWSLDSVTDNLTDAVDGLSRSEAETIARSETASITNTAREIGYEEQFDTDEERFYWQGPENSRTTEACSWLKSRTNPQFGGEPVSMERLKALIQEANDRFIEDHDAREWVPHISCRHAFVRAG